MSLKIPVFVSGPTALNPQQEDAYGFITRCLAEERLAPRALGRSDYPSDNPLMEVLLIARSCFGGVILGFSQTRVVDGIAKEGTSGEKRISEVRFPTPWNNLEAGILFSLQLPMIVFREEGVSGGVLDQGATSKFLIDLPVGTMSRAQREGIVQAVKNWSADVRTRYRRM